MPETLVHIFPVYIIYVIFLVLIIILALTFILTSIDAFHNSRVNNTHSSYQGDILLQDQ